VPRELVRAPGHDRMRSLGWLAVDWIEHFTVHGPGDVQGDAVRLDDEFAGFVVDCYAHNPAGRRLYDDAYISRAKGRAKSSPRSLRYSRRSGLAVSAVSPVVARSTSGATSPTSTNRASRWVGWSRTPS
jgi:hypothetical protein